MNRCSIDDYLLLIKTAKLVERMIENLPPITDESEIKWDDCHDAALKLYEQVKWYVDDRCKAIVDWKEVKSEDLDMSFEQYGKDLM